MKDLFFCFVKIGAFMFGGYSMLPLLQRELVDKRKWVTEDEILDYFSIAQCTPGIIAVNTATFVGYKRGKIGGAVLATLGVILVPMILISVIAYVLTSFAHYAIVQHIFAGVRIAVSALIASAVIRLFRGSVHDWISLLLFLAAFLLMTLLHISPVFVVLGAALVGIGWGRIRKK